MLYISLLGASPGGWTQYLSTAFSHVVAIDPGELDNRISALPNVHHIKALVQSSDLGSYLAVGSYPTVGTNPISSLTVKHRGCSLCVCDMNMDALESAELLVSYVLPFMTPTSDGAFKSLNLSRIPRSGSIIELPNEKLIDFSGPSYIVLTLKLPKNPKEKLVAKIAQSVEEILLRYGCYDFKLIHLHANSINERTLVCKF